MRPQTGPKVNLQKIVGGTFDRDDNNTILVTNEMLLNTLRRDLSLFTGSFDALHEGDLQEMSELLSRACLLIFSGHKEVLRRNDELRMAVSNLLWNSVNTFMGAVTLLRNGFYLQSPILVRSLLETLATVLHLGTVPGQLQKFKDGKLPSRQINLSAKNVLPPYSYIYGELSESFVHSSPIHGEFQPLLPYNEAHAQPLNFNIRNLCFAVWLLYVVAEFSYFDLFPNLEYWKPLEPGKGVYSPSAKTLEWQKKFLTGDIPLDDPQTT